MQERSYWIADGEIFRVHEPPGRSPFRVAMTYVDSVPAGIRPLLDALSLIRDMRHWDAAFRFATLRIPASDFRRIAAAMGCAEATSSTSA